MKFMQRLQRVAERLAGKRVTTGGVVQLGANRRPPIGSVVAVKHDHGPPGLEWMNGWIGLQGRVIYDRKADAIGAVAVEMNVSILPFPDDAMNTDEESVYFLWAPGSLEVIG